MASVSYHIANLLEKMTSSDKDFRFMATNDLMVELQKDSIKLDDDSERKVVKMLLKLLEDKNGEVQNLAVKCLGPLVNKVKEYQVETIVDTLCNNMVSEKEQLRDISSIGLKTVISELPPTSTQLVSSICKKITGRLSNAISKGPGVEKFLMAPTPAPLLDDKSAPAPEIIVHRMSRKGLPYKPTEIKQEDVSVQLEALDILSDLLSRFGGLLITFHVSIQEALLPQLASPRLAVRKRSITAIGYLVMSCSQGLFNKLIDVLLEELSQNNNTSTTRTHIQAIAAISRQAGHRFGEHLEKVMPIIVQYCNVDDDELKEYCLHAFESFVRRCPKEISPHVPTIVKICLKYLCYDPNYNYDDDDADDSMDTEHFDDDEGDSEDEYSDDDDMSWKVRRASAKCLEAVISTRHEMLVEFYKVVSPTLITRFKEREENVKVDIFHAYIALLRQTRPSVTAVALEGDSIEQEDGEKERYKNCYKQHYWLVNLLKQQVPNIIKALHRQLKEKSIKTRQGCFMVLTELVTVLPGALSEHVPALIPGIQYSLGDKNSSSNMKIDTLTFLNCLLSHHQPEIFHPHIPDLVPPIVHSVGDVFYKITSEALLVLQQLVKVIRPLDQPCSFDFAPFVSHLYECTLVRLKAADIDQEVKERAISCMGQIICNLGDHLQVELSVCLPIFLDRLKNEITRLTTVKALTKVAGSSLKINLQPILAEAMPILASFLRKNHRALKLGTLTLLEALVKNYVEYLNQDLINTVLVELPSLISETDLHISQLTMSLLTSISQVQKQPLMNADAILPEILALVHSPLLQGAALNAMLEFFQSLVIHPLPGLGYRDLLGRLTAPVCSVNGQVGQGAAPQTICKQAYHSIAKCVAAITVVCPHEALPVVQMFLQELEAKRNVDSVHLFSLLAIGEIGKHIDLSSITELKTILVDAFSSPSEEVKTAASFALGSVAVGNLPEYLPFVLAEIENQPKRQYLLLHSLKEIISCQSASPTTVKLLQPFIKNVWNMLFNHCECTEEGTRNVVAECLGKLTLIDPAHLLPELKSYLKSDSPSARSTVVTAMKFTISDQPQPIDTLLRSCIGDFLKTLTDPDLNVRRVALVAFNSAAHNKPSLIRDLLDKVLPELYNETKVRKELIREVEMGPFKHTVDDGLDIRKAAFECMYTLLDSCLDRLDIFEFLNHVEDGLRDHYDIKMLTYLMLVRLATLCPSAVLQRIERLIEPLRVTCTSKVKANSVKQEFEKQDELKRSAMRAFTALLGVSDADKNPLMNEFLAQIKSTPDLQSLFESIQKDCSTSVSESSLLMDIS